MNRIAMKTTIIFIICKRCKCSTHVMVVADSTSKIDEPSNKHGDIKIEKKTNREFCQHRSEKNDVWKLNVLLHNSPHKRNHCVKEQKNYVTVAHLYAYAFDVPWTTLAVTRKNRILYSLHERRRSL